MAKVVVGIQGGKGSTNERACKFFAKKYDWDNLEIKYLITTERVLEALSKGKIDYGTFVWESSRAGLVRETQEAIKKYDYKLVNKESFELDHVLLSSGAIDKSKSVNVYSHPQALKEHKPFLELEFNKPELIEEADTSLVAEKLKRGEYPENSLVIAPLPCAEIYDLNVYLKELPTNKGYITTIYLVEGV